MKYVFYLLCFISFRVSAQWDGATGIFGGIFRSGNVSIGTSGASSDGKVAIEGDGEWQIRIRDVGIGGSEWRIGATSDYWNAGGGRFVISNAQASNEAALIIDNQKNVTMARTVRASGFEKNTFGTALTMRHGSQEVKGWEIGRDGDTGVGWLHFDYNGSEKVRVSHLGKVGIGTGNPRAYLDVGAFVPNGTLGATFGRLEEGNTVGAGTYLGAKGYATDVVNGKSFAIEHSFYGVTNSSINFYRGADVSGGFLTFNTDNNTEKMRIDKNGYVGIGTASPDEMLTVAGSIHSREIEVTIDAGQGPDYVFEKDYNLLSLAELEAYIKVNKHLPEVPSAKEMEANGLHLKEMNLLLLKKVEELTLHLIEQKKVNDDQQKMISTLMGQVSDLRKK